MWVGERTEKAEFEKLRRDWYKDPVDVEAIAQRRAMRRARRTGQPEPAIPVQPVTREDQREGEQFMAFMSVYQQTGGGG